MNVKDMVLDLLRKAKTEDSYQNPHFIGGLLSLLEDVYGIEDEELTDWCNDLWGM